MISPQSLQQAAKTPPANASETGTQRRISIRPLRPRRNAAGAAAGPGFSAPHPRRRSRAVSGPLAARHRARCRSYAAAWLRRRPPTARPAASHSRRAAFHRNPATAIPRSESGPPNRAHPSRVPGRSASRSPRRAGPSPKGGRRPGCAGSAPARSARARRARPAARRRDSHPRSCYRGRRPRCTPARGSRCSPSETCRGRSKRGRRPTRPRRRLRKSRRARRRGPGPGRASRERGAELPGPASSPRAASGARKPRASLQQSPFPEEIIFHRAHRRSGAKHLTCCVWSVGLAPSPRGQTFNQFEWEPCWRYGTS